MAGTDLGTIEFGGTLPPLYAALVMQLMMNGTMSPDDLDMLAARVDADGMANHASSLRMLMLSVRVEQEFAARRADDVDGGND